MDQRKKTCPLCNKEYIGVGALSRKDNKTEICSECGSKEAIEVFSNYLKSKDAKKEVE